MNMFMVLLLTFLLQETYALLSPYLPECENLPELEYCQPFNDSLWRLREKCKRCPNGKKYHCCKDYDAKKCRQGIDDCEEVFIEGCAVEKFCKKGEEPLLSYIKNQQEIDQPEVYCDLCRNSNRYNNYANKSSATFSECPFVKKNICTPQSHKIECRKSDETSERFCRCDVSNGYRPYSHPDDHPHDGCSFTNYECRNDIKECGPNQQLLLNYTCACKKGFSRPEDSDACVATSATPFTGKHEEKSFTKSISTLSSFTTTWSPKKTSKPIDISTIFQGPVSTTEHQNNQNGLVWISFVAAIVLVGVGVGAVISIAFVTRVYYCQKRGRYEEVPLVERGLNSGIIRDEQKTHPSINNKFIIKGHYINAKAETLQMSNDGTGNVIKMGNTVSSVSSSSSSLKTSTENIFPHQVDKNNTSSGKTPSSRTHSLKRKRSLSCPNIERENMLDEKDVQNLTEEEFSDFVSKVLLRNHTYLVKCLNPKLLHDNFAEKELFLHSQLRDIMELPTTSEKNREFLKRVVENVDIYRPFIEALLHSKQSACLNALKSEELTAYKEIMANRKSKQKTCSNEEINETGKETKTFSSNSASYSHSEGFLPSTGQTASYEQNSDTKEVSKSRIHRSFSDEKDDENLDSNVLISEGDDTPQLEHKAKQYLRRLKNVSADFMAFVKEGELVEVDVNENYPKFFDYPHTTTITKFERLEKEKSSPAGFEAYKSTGFQNSCLYQSVSILLRGDEQLQNRLRLQTTLHCSKEWTKYKRLFTTHFQSEEVDRVKSFFFANVTGEASERILDMTDIEDIIEESLKALIIEIAHIGKDSSRLHVQFLSDVIEMPIEQHFEVKTYFREPELILPRLLPLRSDAETLHVYWMDFTGKKEKMNHIVPLKKVVRS